MAFDASQAIERVARDGNVWQRWRAARMDGSSGEDPSTIPGQDDEGWFAGPSGRPSPGATGLALCHLEVLDLGSGAAAVIAADWLEEARTPARAWLDALDDVPGELETPAAGRVWATASATCALLAVRRDPGHRAIDLLRGEADQEGRFTGGAYPTYAAAGAYWLAQGPKTEMAEWALRWAREWTEEWWGPEEWTTALTFWAAAGIPAEHASVDAYVGFLADDASPDGWTDIELTMRAIEVLDFFGA